MRRLALASVFVMVLGLAATAQAQVCGDANGDGEVTDTDGVQVLRAAALLSSVCTDAACDVNGDGQITDTDGVLTLRKAALLPIEENCPGGETGGTVETVSDDLLPFFGILVPQFPGIDAAAAGFSEETEDCPEGGTRTKRDLVTQQQVQFDACRISSPLGSFEFDGNVALNLALPQVFLTVDVTDLDSGRLVHFEGTIDPEFGPNDTIIFTGGPVVISTPQGDFEMFFEDLTFNQDGEPISGSGTIEDNDDNFDLDLIEFTANGNDTATLVATFDDLTEETFLLNLLTGTLTPQS